MGHAFWTCPLKVAGVGMSSKSGHMGHAFWTWTMGSPRLARIIGFLGFTQCILISTQSPQVFAV